MNNRRATITEAEMRAALAAFNEAKGNRRAAAELLGIHYESFRRHLNKAMENEDALDAAASEAGFPVDDVTGYWVKSPHVSAYVTRKQQPATYFEMRDEIIASMREHAPHYTPIKHEGGDHLLIVDMADVHINKRTGMHETGYNYDIKTAVERAREGVTSLLAKAVPHGISKICLVIGNDVLNTDADRGTTTGGTSQDMDGLWWEAYNAAKMCYIGVVEELTQVADVHVVHCPSNHDRVSGYFLADTLASWFRNNQNVHFGEDNRQASMAHRKYIVWANATIGFTHGDGAKEKELPNLMQHEARKAWGDTKYGYWYVHHLHHKIRKGAGVHSKNMEKDHVGVTVIQQGAAFDPAKNVYVEYVRSPSPEDSWHDRKGYTNMQAIECFLHDATGFQCGRFSHAF